MTLQERLAYLRGLAEGLEFTDSTPQGKLLLGVLDVLDTIVEDECYLLASQLEREALEEDGAILCFPDDDTDDDAAYDRPFVGCGTYASDDDADDFPYPNATRLALLSAFQEFLCPACGRTLYFDKSTLANDSLPVCPACGETTLASQSA